MEQQRKQLPPILKQETVKLFWDPVIKCHKDGDNFAGLGKFFTRSMKVDKNFTKLCQYKCTDHKNCIELLKLG